MTVTGDHQPATRRPQPEPRAATPASCCAPAAQTSCCEPAEKSACCGAEATASGGCGCR